LGVSILYLCLAQRLGLDLEIITPPGHIFVRYCEGKTVTNIETTARGIDVPSEYYLGIETKRLQTRTLKETIGLAFANQAAAAWTGKKNLLAISLYEKALCYLQDDPLMKEFLAYNYLLAGKEKEGKKLLEQLSTLSSPYSTSKNDLIEDFLNGKTDIEGIATIFLPVDENRISILEKQLQLISVLKKKPDFRQGLLQLATTYLQLGREKEATFVLKRYQAIDSASPLINYYLSELSLERHDYKAAWKFFSLASSILRDQGHFPKALKDLRKALIQISPPSEKAF
jgi:tetratricopeptide (TPR) repeat protein